MLRDKFLVNTLTPNTYSCFLSHQMVGQIYYAITRSGSFWNYYSPLPVEWYEYFLIVGLMTYFSHITHNSALPLMREAIREVTKWCCLKKKVHDDDFNSVV